MAPRDPEELTAGVAPPAAEIPSSTRPGPVHLIVAELDRSIAFYERAIGLRLQARDGERVHLGAGQTPLLVLHERPGARPVRGACGLYHFALLVPERIDLARWLAHATRERLALSGLSDHFVSEAIYLSDPDGHGIEIYCDRPRAVWEGMVAERMTTLPLDVDDLLGELDDHRGEPFSTLAPGSVMGHVHLCVADVPQAVGFYRDVLGLGLMAALGSHAAFLSAGGYHHHVGLNSWESAGAGQPPPDAARLHHATLSLDGAEQRDRLAERVEASGQEPQEVEDGVLVRDPCGNALVLASAS
jgi:catechol 2,3-dioxygenase